MAIIQARVGSSFPQVCLKNLRPTPSGNAEDLEGGGARAMSMQQGGFLSVFREMSTWG